MRPGRLVALGIGAAVVAGCTAVPSITWQPQPIAITLEPNAYRIYGATLHARIALPSVDLGPSPSVRQLVSVIPATVTNLGDDTNRRIRLAFALPPTARPGARITGRLEAADQNGPLADAMSIMIDVVPSTPEGTLESLRVALENGEESAYLAQFVPARRPQERRTYAGLTDTARLALAQTLRTAERISLDGNTAEYRIYLLLSNQRFESSILLQQSSADGIWRVVRF